jgi:hypothetical protein
MNPSEPFCLSGDNKTVGELKKPSLGGRWHGEAVTDKGKSKKDKQVV